MILYKVIAYFEDLKDGGKPYNVGDIYPKGDIIPTRERVAELSSGKNRRHIPLIKKVEDPNVEKPSKKGNKKDTKESKE